METPVGVEVKNAGLSRFLKGSSSINSLWPSNLPESGKVDNLILVESPINAPSMAQLAKDGHKDLMNISGKDNLYIATGGSYTEAKIAEIQKLIDKYNPTTLVLANDKGNSGVRYDFNLLGQLERLSSDPTKDNLKANLDLISKDARVTFTLTAETSESALLKLAPLKERFDNAFDKETYTTNLLQSGDHTAKLEVTYYNAYEHNLFALRVLEGEKGLENSVQISKPKGFDNQGKIMSDWNDVLMDVNNIDKTLLGRKSVGLENMNTQEIINYFDLSKAGAKVEMSAIKNDVLFNKTSELSVSTETNDKSKSLDKVDSIAPIPTYSEFITKLSKEQSAVFDQQEVPTPVEKAFYKWQSEEILIFKQALDNQQLSLTPEQSKDLNSLIEVTNLKAGSTIPLLLSNNNSVVNQYDTSSKLDSLVANDGPESLERLDTNVDNNLVHTTNNDQSKESSFENQKDERAENAFTARFKLEDDNEMSR